MNRKSVTAFAVLAIVVAVVAIVAADRDSDSLTIGPAGGAVSEGEATVVVPEGAAIREVEVEVQRRGESATKLLPGMRALAPVYSIEVEGELRRPVQLRFVVDGARGGRVYVASREAEGEMWVLQPAKLTGDGREAFISTRNFSMLQPLVAEAGAAAATLLRFSGVRAEEPRCGPPPFGYELVGDIGSGDANALIFACLEATDSGIALHLVNNRALGMEYSLPAGLRPSAQSSPELPEAVLDAMGAVQGSGWRSIPAAGEAVLTGQAGERKVVVKPTFRAFVFDLAVFGLGKIGGRAAKAAGTLDYLACAREGANRLGSGPPPSAKAARDAALGIWRSCAETLDDVARGANAMGGALFFGGMKLGTGATDAIAQFFTRQRAELQIAKAPSATLSFTKEGGVEAVGPFSVPAGDRTIADAVGAFGEPGSIEPGPAGCELTWPELGLKADAVNYGARGMECMPEGGFINDFVITSSLFQTEAGLRVGMSENELLARHPLATTRGEDPTFDDEFAPPGTLYGLEQMASPISSTGLLTTLKALVQEDEVVGLEVTPLLGGD